MDAQKFCLKWDGFQGSVTSVFDHLRRDSELVDVTLCCDGQRVRAHRMMLSACSPYFRELFRDLPCQQLVVFLKDTAAADLTAIVEFMYKGSVNVAQSQLASFIKTAEMLQVQGLSGGEDKEAPSPAAPAAEPRSRPWSQPPASPGQSGLRPSSETAAEPAEPRPKRRRPDPPPPPPPPAASPAPPPAAPAAPLGTLLKTEEVEQEQTGAQLEAAVKVEKFDVDLTLEDDEEAAGEELEAALGHVAHYEGYDGGSDQSLSADGQLFPAGADGAAAANVGAGGAYPTAPSQRTGEDGSQEGPATCHICGTTYTLRRNLTEHMKKHRGEARCPLCQQDFAAMRNMRRHMVSKHGMSQQEVDTVTKKRPRMPAYFTEICAGQVLSAEEVSAITAMASSSASLAAPAAPSAAATHSDKH